MLSLRAATREDLDFLVTLRNDPQSVRFSKRGVLDAEEVERDFLGRPDKRAFVAQERGEPVGYAVFEDLGHRRAEIGIAIAPRFRGRRLARVLIERAVSLALEALGFEAIRAEIDRSNTPSLRAFVSAGFRSLAEPGSQPRLACYELRSAWRQSALVRERARGPARPPPAPPPRGS